MTRLYRALLVVTIASILTFTGLAVWLAIEVVQAERAIVAQTLLSERTITASIASIPVLTDAHLVVLERKIDVLQATATGAIALLDSRLASIQKDAAAQLQQVNGSLASVTNAASAALPAIARSADSALLSVSADVHQVAAPIAGTAAQLNDAAPLYLDCEFNPSCAYNFFQGTAKSVQQSAQAIAKAAPQMAESAAKIEGHVDSISGSVDREVTEFTKPKRWWQHVEDFLKIGVESAARIF